MYKKTKQQQQQQNQPTNQPNKNLWTFHIITRAQIQSRNKSTKHV